MDFQRESVLFSGRRNYLSVVSTLNSHNYLTVTLIGIKASDSRNRTTRNKPEMPLILAMRKAPAISGFIAFRTSALDSKLKMFIVQCSRENLTLLSLNFSNVNLYIFLLLISLLCSICLQFFGAQSIREQ